MDITADFFSLFQLPRAFRLDGALDHRYREIQGQVHPDRFAQAGDAERRLSMQWATRANEATRPEETAGAGKISAAAGRASTSGQKAIPPWQPNFCWNRWNGAKALEARAAGAHGELEHLYHRLRADIAVRYDELGQLLDEGGDLNAAGEAVRRLMFLEKLLHEIDDAPASLEE